MKIPSLQTPIVQVIKIEDSYFGKDKALITISNVGSYWISTTISKSSNVQVNDLIQLNEFKIFKGIFTEKCLRLKSAEVVGRLSEQSDSPVSLDTHMKHQRIHRLVATCKPIQNRQDICES